MKTIKKLETENRIEIPDFFECGYITALKDVLELIDEVSNKFRAPCDKWIISPEKLKKRISG